MLSEGRLLGHYRLVRRIGSGGMGEVYLAEDTRINRQVAIKVVRTEAEPYPDPVTTQDTARLFQREMRAITMLDHPHILPLFDFGEEQDENTTLTYMVMPYRPEGSLATWLHQREKSKKLTPNETASLVMQAADALQHAHDHHLIHQDVKPSNFLVRKRSGQDLPDLLLMDFGIVKMTTATATASQSIRGTPAFMAPEQWRGRPEVATDQYALAVMAYLLLTGRPPFLGRMEQVMHQHLMVQPQPPSHLRPAVSPALDAVILRGLEKEPDKRFPSILAFAQALQQALQATDNQDQTVPALKKEQAAIDERADLEKHAQTVDAPPSPTGSVAKSGESTATVTASNTNLPLELLTTDTQRMSQPPLPFPDPLASASIRTTKKTRLPLALFITLLVIIAGAISVVSINANSQNQMNTSATSAVNTATSQADASATLTAQTTVPAILSISGTWQERDNITPQAQSTWNLTQSQSSIAGNGSDHEGDTQTITGFLNNLSVTIKEHVVQNNCDNTYTLTLNKTYTEMDGTLTSGCNGATAPVKFFKQ